MSIYKKYYLYDDVYLYCMRVMSIGKQEDKEIIRQALETQEGRDALKEVAEYWNKQKK